ncbi:MAG: bifunctional phosphoribosyl-AMP cyclohydrolase/phosphoribosyl-ATP diphosphatase HisIE [Anaerolineales bacterium]
MNAFDLKFDERGLIPAVVQDAVTGAVLMVAWMNAEALRLTRETGLATFWSRSRQEIWQKGGTSGNVQRVCEIRVDCDGDTLLLRVRPAGPACHTGARSCFYRAFTGEGELRPLPPEEPESGDLLDELFDVILERKSTAPPGSYTASLLADPDEALKKVGEEAVEVILAAKGQSDQRLTAEAADLLYHLLVVLATRDLTLAAVRQELARRRR